MLTSTHLPGAPAWLDLGTPDIDGAISFYSAVFGWEYASAGPAVGYGFFRLGGRTVAGVGPLTEEGAGPAWTVYFRTADADATAKAVERAGGTVRMPPGDVFTAGRAAGFTDPTGAEFAVWQAGDVQGLDLVNAPGSAGLVELYTTDLAAARAFYCSVLPWDIRDLPVGGGLQYAVAGPAGAGPDAVHGGLMQLPGEHRAAGARSEWHPYFETDDCDTTLAAAADHGATVVIGAMDAPGSGRMGMVLDPFGAPFAVLTSSRR
ncbi:hydroxylase [Streptomyces mashuensis]|uniref:Hydroxylase n=1 Tax=Streptomyces mashuensis TaxID=33904 RepID=A0A919ED45_9ACTN|nr:VOC family protein [Streptomyces mashuensis]GHF54684.1 hydroxylase [Streptomyces mashuensis]